MVVVVVFVVVILVVVVNVVVAVAVVFEVLVVVDPRNPPSKFGQNRSVTAEILLSFSLCSSGWVSGGYKVIFVSNPTFFRLG